MKVGNPVGSTGSGLLLLSGKAGVSGSAGNGLESKLNDGKFGGLWKSDDSSGWDGKADSSSSW